MDCRCYFLVLVFALVVSPSSGSTCCDGTTCSSPKNPKQLFDCSATAWSQLTATFPPSWYLSPVAQSFGIPKRCYAGNRTFLSCTKDADCGGGTGSCASKTTSAYTLVDQYMACCRYCVWDMQFPMGAPIQVTSGPVPAQSQNELFMIPTLNCTKFPAEFAQLDVNGDKYLSPSEFSVFFQKLPMRELVADGMLNQTMVEWAADLNKDLLISYPEYAVLRHFWTPAMISNSGSVSNSAINASNGPLGGLFYDKVMVSVWVTTANNILLRLYIINNWDSSATREPLDGEEASYVKNSDLDGTGRISLEEHYFRVFADMDHSGDLNEAEFQLSLYSDTIVLKSGISYPARYSFAQHDLDGSGTISFLERKRLSADRNLDGVLDYTEWVLGDFPDNPVLFAQHATAAGTIGPAEYQYYQIYDFCSLFRWQLYNSDPPTNGIPWNYQACTLNVVLWETAPFVMPAPSAAVAGRRQLAVSGSGAPTLSGYTPGVWSLLSNTLGFQQTVGVIPGAEDASTLTLSPPVVGPTGKTVTFQVALLNRFATPAPQWSCSTTLWPAQDGFVLVVRAAPDAVSLYLVALTMVVSPQFVNFFCSLFFLVLGVGHIIWLIERWSNGLQFRKFYAEGVLDGLWWAIVTQTSDGFGDKAPATLPGKAFAVFWMVFGLITFAIFAGQATTFISQAVNVNSVTDWTNLAGISAGTLAGTPGVQLAQTFSFSNVNCAGGMADCAARLLTKEIDAIVAPRPDVVAYFVSSGLNDGPCGNPLMIVAQPLPAGFVAGDGPGIQACTFGSGVYAGSQLIAAITAGITSLAAAGNLDSLSAQVDQYQTVPDNCIAQPTYMVPLNAAAAATLMFYAIGRMVERWYFKPPPAEAQDIGDVAQSIMALTRKGRAGGDGGTQVDSLECTGILPELDGVGELMAATRRVGLFHAMQSGSVRKMQKEMRKQKRLLRSVVAVMALAAGSVACGMAAVVGVLIALWSEKIQLSQYAT